MKPSLARRCVETATPTKIWQVHPTGGHVESTGTFIYQIMVLLRALPTSCGEVRLRRLGLEPKLLLAPALWRLTAQENVTVAAVFEAGACLMQPLGCRMSLHVAAQ